MNRISVLLILIGAAVVLLGEGFLRMEPGLPSLRAEVVPFRPDGRPAVVASMPDIPSNAGGRKMMTNPLRGPTFGMVSRLASECWWRETASLWAMV